MPVSRGSGYPNYSTNASNYIPEIYSGKLVRKFYASTVFGEIANTEYAGEIKDQGSTVHIATVPDITIGDYEIGVDMGSEVLNSDGVNLEIDRAKYFNFLVEDIDKLQSHIELDRWTDASSNRMKIAIDSDILGSIPADVAATNAGATAGKLSGNINLGTAATPVTLTKDNVLDYIIDLNVVLGESDIPEDGRWIVIPTWTGGMIKKSDLKDASLTGDNTSIARNGRIGIIDGCTIYTSNLLSHTGGNFDILAGHKSGLTFASQMTKTRIIELEKRFGVSVQGLNVYGFEVINDTALAHGVITR